MGLREAITDQMKWDTTDNGEVCLNTSGSNLVDFLARSGAMREADDSEIILLFDRAFMENPTYALRLLFYARDIREGYGERDTFNKMLKYAANKYPDSVEKNISAIMKFGRAKDLYSLIGTKAEDTMWLWASLQLKVDLDNMKQGKSVSLLAKWLASTNSGSKNTKKLGYTTALNLGYEKKDIHRYAKDIASLRKYMNLPEIQMAAGQWDEIDYSKCASQCMLKHRNAFRRHDDERFQEYIDLVTSGEAKMNTGTLNPCDIISQVLLHQDDINILEAMWGNLEDIVNANVLVMCDTSGSMHSGEGNMPPFVVANSLALYFAEHNKGSLKDLFMTFSERPEFVNVAGGGLREKLRRIEQANWNMSTDLEKAYKLLLDTCIEGKVEKSEMPEFILVVSDMQIDGCCDGYDNGKLTFYSKMAKLFSSHGYKLPKVVFWNVNAKKATFHASFDDSGVALVSGYSVNIFKQLIESFEFTPYEIMLKIVESDRYSDIVA